MEFYLNCSLKTSADPAVAKDAIAKIMAEAETGILAKGAPVGEGAKIKSWSLGDNKINLELTSGKNVRVHDAVLRLRKQIAEALGKSKIGVRGLDVEKFTITVPSHHDLKNKSIPYVKSVLFDEKAQTLCLELDVGESEMKNQVPDRILTLLEDKIEQVEYGAKAEHWHLLWESEDRPFHYVNDPTEDMLKSGWLKRGAGRGQWIHGSASTKLFRTFEKIVVDEILTPLGYNEMIFPKMIMWDIWKHSGHAKGIYPEIYYVCPPKTRDPAYWEDVMDYYKVTREVPVELIKTKIGDPIGGMCYAQCPPCWGFFQGETIAKDSLPIRVFDRSGTSHRYESGGIHGIERVDEFHRIELVWLGTKEQVVETTQKLHERYMHIFNDILDLKWRKAWVTPWFMAQEGLAGIAADEVTGTTDYEAPLPYRGKDGEWLEFQNVSINGEKYPEGFNVKCQTGEPLWSGCSGVGLERWTATFLAQHGLDPENWPEEFKKRFGEMPKIVKFM
ncbi:serine--tRNA ligase [Methanolapillus millepedarum]|uniref:Aminoacyl-transfer RNA synthetases class-II family profile domain-containing protein n=1 Tax=Methanolapillus millepedarum TaxID=3028296 RepID=A0AA96V2N7_9EURY|nr:hypothetical protein MsAc7_09420 [Methanosarcinaceae archaeon Ac7]